MAKDITEKLNDAIVKALNEERRPGEPPHLELGGIFDMILAFIEKIMALCPMATAAQVKAHSKLARQPIRGIFARSRMAREIEPMLSGGRREDVMKYVNVVARVGESAETQDIEEFMEKKKDDEFSWE